MSRMIRKQVYLEARQERTLKTLAKHSAVTEADIIRQALDLFFAERDRAKRREAAWKREQAFLEQRMKAGPLSGERSWRREDLYDRKVFSRH